MIASFGSEDDGDMNNCPAVPDEKTKCLEDIEGMLTLLPATDLRFLREVLVTLLRLVH